MLQQHKIYNVVPERIQRTFFQKLIVCVEGFE